MTQAMEEPKRLFRVALYKEGTSPMEICAAMRHAGNLARAGLDKIATRQISQATANDSLVEISA
jgi:hypothetical protein